MALSQTYRKNIYGQEIIFEKSYHQITQVAGNKFGLDIHLTIYNNKNKENVLEKKYYFFIPSVADNSPNFIKQCYRYLKTLDEFQDGLDILEEGQTA